ncbi:ORF MSV262 155 amino acid repeat gene family protein [Melanoplus sanguinipes entomopoxvirus]|uniref:ORF MSV004 155 amino acid repeat gene family protein n=1 Tax=Melanoplus sanguinipes entomopoxvirus TaxID=83191 RepID=Q9YJ98_MSEPV|nr:ORF MSV004 155 amino acid repeat gene family protein [Melanoplus sanguinipes entomopoxvirus]NP_048333.1 ORF MSV262 155 amino acid repeat gene family protein [Melanoplus sanguinipes entomopoxvirus]AAC97736.1 ORF MSV262 155 amino acid repeat gene family protein [Melanoplus sanguinipes entomopoxvirus 'O']AAC97868.1 ORF MSV004 155 amino acid repeat gene family protein [Melanoplus sanguinipes entomopoxvirus 'O']
MYSCKMEIDLECVVLCKNCNVSSYQYTDGICINCDFPINIKLDICNKCNKINFVHDGVCGECYANKIVCNGDNTKSTCYIIIINDQKVIEEGVVESSKDIFISDKFTYNIINVVIISNNKILQINNIDKKYEKVFNRYLIFNYDHVILTQQIDEI